MDEQVVRECVTAVLALRASARQARSWSTQRRHEVLSELERLDALLVGVRSDLLAAEQDAQTWQQAGVPSLGARLGRDTGVGRAAGNARVHQADTWADVPVLARAAEAGTITTGHVEALGRVARGVDPRLREALTSPEGQNQLVALATRMDAPTFAKELARTAARLDPSGPERDLARQREARHLHVVDTPDGTKITGLLDHQSGRRFRLALEAVCPRPAAEDSRTPPQRRADGLVDLADTVLSLPDTGSGAAVRPHVSVVMSVETLAELRAAQARRAADSEDTPTSRPLAFVAPVDPATDEDGDVVPFSEVSRVLCDCFMTRIVIDAAGEPVDLGRQARLYTGAQRRAVLARDRGCAWEGCSVPARWCEIHHIWWWDRDDGPTSVDNGVTLCRFHHQVVHQRDLHLVRHPADLPPGIGRTIGRRDTARTGLGDAWPPDAGPGGPDPGRPTVRYVIQARDGTVVAGGPERARSRRNQGPPGQGASRQEVLPLGA